MSKKPSPKPVAAYLRLSVATEESVSIAGQERIVRAACAARGWADPVLFIDENVSGSKSIRRVARDDLERRIAAGEFGAVVVKSVDRLARSVGDFHRIAKTATAADCALVVVEANLDTSTPAGKMLLGILATFAEFESDMIGARVRTSNEQIREQGRARGGPVPYGLVNAPNPDGPGMVRVVDPSKAGVLRRMVAEILSGASMRQIAADLSADGIPAPRKRTDGNPGVWDQNAVKRALTNPAIAGMEVALGEYVRDNETGLRRLDKRAAILDLPTFERVLDTVGARAQAPRVRRFAERPLLDDLAVCAGCGRSLRRQTSHGGTYETLSCSGSMPRHKCPAPASAATRRLNEFVVSHVLDAFGHLPATEIVEMEGPRDSEALLLVRAEAKETAARFATADPSEIHTLADRLASLRSEETRLRAEAEAVETIAIPRDLGYTWAEAYERAEDAAARREILSRFLRRVTLSKATRRGQPLDERVVLDFSLVPDSAPDESLRPV